MPKKDADSIFQFDGIATPNTTPCPDVYFDQVFPQLKESELKVLLYIVRRTFGFKKNRDPISFNQFLRGITTRDGRVFDRGCGLSDKTTLSRALKSLETMGVIVSDKGVDERGENSTTVYSLRFKEKESEGVVGNSYHPGMDRTPPVVGISYSQQTVEQETGIQQTESSSRFELQTTHKHNKNNVISKKREISKLGSTPAAAESERRSRATPTPSSPPIVPPPAVLGRASRPGSPAPGPASHPTPRRGRPPQATAQIAALIEQFSGEFHDEEHTKPNISQAARLWKASGLSEEAFCQRLFDARARTLQAPGIEKRARGDAGALGLRNKMPYYFIVLRDVLGMRDDPAGPSPTISP